MRIIAGNSGSLAPVRRRYCGASVMLSLAVLFLACLTTTAGAQSFGVRSVQGRVLGAQNKAVSGAIVYLKNSRNNDIKTYISTGAGSYQFVDLAADTDYTLWAAWKGQKSSTKTVSSFDTRKTIHIDLHVK